MEKFTYQDYLKYTREGYDYTSLMEESTEYNFEKIHQYRDKGYKVILDNKNEAVQLINRVLEIENTEYEINNEQIEKYNSSFITQDFKSKESDLVYKKKGEDIFFLIEQQSKVDYTMAYRILNYCIEIIRSAMDQNKFGKKAYQIPAVYPIVLYTGKEKWNAKKYIEECQMKLKGAKRTTFASYNLMDINCITEEDLWCQNNFLSKMLLLEKIEEGQIEEYFTRIGNESFTNQEINILIHMMYGSLNRKMNQNRLQEFIQKIKSKQGGDHMGLTALERYWDRKFDEKMEQGLKQGMQKGMEQGIEKGIEKGIKKGIKKGIEKGKKEYKIAIILKMLKNNMDEEIIKKMTEITQKELEEIKKQA